MVSIHIFMMADIKFIFMSQLFVWVSFWNAHSYLILTDRKLFIFPISSSVGFDVSQELCQFYLNCLIYWYNCVQNNLYPITVFRIHNGFFFISDINLYFSFFFIFMTNISRNLSILLVLLQNQCLFIFLYLYFSSLIYSLILIIYYLLLTSIWFALL